MKQGYKTPYRLDASSTSGGVLVYVNENIPSRPLLKLTLPSDIQLIPFELCLRKTKWLIIFGYKLPNMNNNYFLSEVNKLI